jgi:hypothetical protein
MIWAGRSRSGDPEQALRSTGASSTRLTSGSPRRIGSLGCILDELLDRLGDVGRKLLVHRELAARQDGPVHAGDGGKRLHPARDLGGVSPP